MYAIPPAALSLTDLIMDNAAWLTLGALVSAWFVFAAILGVGKVRDDVHQLDFMVNKLRK